MNLLSPVIFGYQNDWKHSFQKSYTKSAIGIFLKFRRISKKIGHVTPKLEDLLKYGIREHNIIMKS